MRTDQINVVLVIAILSWLRSAENILQMRGLPFRILTKSDNYR